MDLGPESYNKIESQGMNLWGKSQDAERWTIFRYNNLSHSTLVVNSQYQRVDCTAPIIRYSEERSFPHVVFDMSEVYEGQLVVQGIFRTFLDKSFIWSSFRLTTPMGVAKFYRPNLPPVTPLAVR